LTSPICVPAKLFLELGELSVEPTDSFPFLRECRMHLLDATLVGEYNLEDLLDLGAEEDLLEAGGEDYVVDRSANWVDAQEAGQARDTRTLTHLEENGGSTKALSRNSTGLISACLRGINAVDGKDRQRSSCSLHAEQMDRLRSARVDCCVLYSFRNLAYTVSSTSRHCSSLSRQEMTNRPNIPRSRR
jgi:hypothetical protein